MHCSRNPAGRRSTSRSLAPSLALLLSALAGTAGAQEQRCAPFEGSAEFEQPVVVRDAGIAPSERSEPSTTGGAIVPLAASSAPTTLQALAGEALLALPKQADGSIPSDYELAAGTQLAESFFSRVLCATVARIVGPEGASPAELVPVVPRTGVVVAHTRYVGASERVEPATLDPYLPLQYGLDQLGVLAARPVTDGAGVSVAVLDSAPASAHRELARVRVVALEGGPSAEPAAHGTLVAGVIAATEGNGFGIAGVAPGADVVAIPVCSPVGASASDECRLYDVLRGIDRAWQLDAEILNLSIVGPPNRLLERAVARLAQLGHVVVAAAGNEATRELRFPAAYPLVIGVGSLDASGALAERSNRGPSVELLAPGVEILSTLPGDAFAFVDGSSLAAAHVSGVLALLTAASGDVARARGELLAAAQASARGGPARTPRACEVLARLGRACR